MSQFSYRRLEHDLHWGCRLEMVQAKYCQYGFRGKAKGKGFRAYLKENNIPVRKAYRLIERYRMVEGLLEAARNGNAAFRNQLWPSPPKDAVAALRKLRESMCDNDSVTNAVVNDEGKPLPSLEDAAKLRAALDAISDNDSVTDEP